MTAVTVVAHDASGNGHGVLRRPDPQKHDGGANRLSRVPNTLSGRAAGG
jgi:hypothetical protein